jgi:hypothetical protein
LDQEIEDDTVSKLGEDMEKLTEETPDLMTLAQRFTEAKNTNEANTDLVHVNMSDYDSLVNNPPVQSNLKDSIVNYEKLRSARHDYEKIYTHSSPDINSKREGENSPTGSLNIEVTPV